MSVRNGSLYALCCCSLPHYKTAVLIIAARNINIIPFHTPSFFLVILLMILFDEGIYLVLVRREGQLVYRIIEIRFIDYFRINLLHQLLLFTVETIKNPSDGYTGQ